MIEKIIRRKLKCKLSIPITYIKKFYQYNRSFINTDTYYNSRMNKYSFFKKQFLRDSLILCKLNKIKYINVKLFHLFGPNDNYDKFLIFIINNLKKNTEVINLTSCEQKRDFIYIDDVVKLYLKILFFSYDNKKYIEFQLGNGKVYTLKYNFIS